MRAPTFFSYVHVFPCSLEHHTCIESYEKIIKGFDCVRAFGGCSRTISDLHSSRILRVAAWSPECQVGSIRIIWKIESDKNFHHLRNSRECHQNLCRFLLRNLPLKITLEKGFFISIFDHDHVGNKGNWKWITLFWFIFELWERVRITTVATTDEKKNSEK